MKSTCRRLIYKKLGLQDKAKPTGDAAFRVSIPLESVTDPELRAFMTEPIATRWMGPDRHIQGYPIRHGTIYNMVLQPFRVVSLSLSLAISVSRCHGTMC